MELEELKSTWLEMSHQIEKQKELNDKMILDMTKLKFTNKIKTIANFEGLGAIILLVMVVYMILNISVFDTLPLKIAAFACIFVMIALPVLSLSSIYRMHSIDVSKGNQKDILIEFTKRRSQFLVVQKWAIGLSFILLFAILPVAMKLFRGKDFFVEKANNSLWFIPIALIGLLFFARWGYNCYKNITGDAEKLLSELKE